MWDCESIRTIKLHSFSDQPKTQKVSHLDLVLSELYSTVGRDEGRLGPAQGDADRHGLEVWRLARRQVTRVIGWRRWGGKHVSDESELFASQRKSGQIRPH